MHSANGDTLEGSFLNVADAGPKVGSITFAATLSFALASAIGLFLIVVAAQPMGAQDEGVIYNFPGYSNGQTPQASMILDNKGNLYGTTTQGGVHGYGAVFEVIVAGNKGPRERVLHSFSINSNPVSSLVFDGMGNFYGTTVGGGKVNEYCPQGCGVVFELTTGGKYTVLYKFKGGFDGANPYGGLAIDSMGNLYGTTRNGGMGGPQYDCGTEFELSAGVETILYAFSGSDGCYPTAGLVTDGYGNLYGTTPQGGAGYGTVFESDTFGDLTTLHYFAGGSDGAYPLSSLVLDDSGFVYGTTQQGGGADCGGTGCGTVYEVDPTIPRRPGSTVSWAAATALILTVHWRFPDTRSMALPIVAGERRETEQSLRCRGPRKPCSTGSTALQTELTRWGALFSALTGISTARLRREARRTGARCITWSRKISWAGHFPLSVRAARMGTVWLFQTQQRTYVGNRAGSGGV